MDKFQFDHLNIELQKIGNQVDILIKQNNSIKDLLDSLLKMDRVTADEIEAVRIDVSSLKDEMEA